MNPKIALARLSRSARAGEFSASDIAGAIGFVRHRQAADLILLLWCGHADKRAQVLQDICVWAQRQPDYMNIDRAVGLATLAIDEISNPRVCKPCGGLGLERGSPTGETCPKCHGLGTVPRSNSARAKAIGIHRKNWPRHAAMYDAIVQRLNNLEGLALGRLKRALNGDPCHE